MLRCPLLNTMAILNPFPRGPSKLPSGILQSSRMMLAVDVALMPSLSSFFPRESPGCGRGIRNALIPCRYDKKPPEVSERSPSEQPSIIYVLWRWMPCVWAACPWWRAEPQRTLPSCWWSRPWSHSTPTRHLLDELSWRQHLRRCHYLQDKSIQGSMP